MIQINGVDKYYGLFQALHQINCDIQRGMINGLVGPNGSGKTTLIHCILNQLEYSGEINWSIDNSTIFFIPDENILPDLLTGKEFLLFIESLYKKKDDSLKNQLLIEFDLVNDYEKPIASFSYGMKKKIQMIAALIVKPDILILDEIFRGLDMKAIRDTKNNLLNFVRQGNTVLLSSHDILAVEQLCQSVLFLSKGHLKAFGNPFDLVKENHAENLEDLFIKLM